MRSRFLFSFPIKYNLDTMAVEGCFTDRGLLWTTLSANKNMILQVGMTFLITFYCFISDNNKQYGATTYSYMRTIIHVISEK